MDYVKRYALLYVIGNIDNSPKAYLGINKNEEIREESSSGGIFTVIAQEILRDGNGIVFGAAFDENFIVKHIEICDEKELYKLRTSKYVQSDISNTYQRAESYLKKGKNVLFTGTPCQIEGLKSYLMKEYENLYTQDIICHGVPSPLIWEKYKNYRKKVDSKNPENINFRNKDNGWHEFNLKFSYDNGKYSKSQNKDLYMKAFLDNLILRDSCYKCSFKKYNRNSDITLADFWGIENIKSKLDDNKGISLIIVNSKKGQSILNRISVRLCY